MDNDVISRSALKEKMSKYIVSTNHGAIRLTTDQKANNEAILDCISFIDNAPTVNFDKTSFVEGFKAGCNFGKEGYEKPQGDCQGCEFRKFSEKMITIIVDLMNKYGIVSIEELENMLKGDAE